MLLNLVYLLALAVLSPWLVWRASPPGAIAANWARNSSGE